MRKLRKKLHSTSGASMLMALLLLLVALMVSAVIVAAALSSALSIRSDRAQQQSYLTVSSAAELMRDKMEGGSCRYEQVVTTLYASPSKLAPVSTNTANNHANGAFSSIIYEAIGRIQATNAAFSKVYTITADGYDPVTAEVFMKRENDLDGNPCYRLTVWFTGGSTPNPCRLVLTMDGVETTDVRSSTIGAGDALLYQDITTTTVEWKNASIQRKEAGGQ